MEHLKKVFAISGYTKSSWKVATTPKKPSISNDPSLNKTKGSITLPYVGHMTNNIA